jgi:choline dehydrogenase-like flavoprotein
VTVIFPYGATRRIDHKTASERLYDAIVVGAGISGAIIADELSRAGNHVLVLEAGPGEDMTLAGYEAYVEHFHATAYKDNQSPYPESANAPMPRSTDVRTIRDYTPDTRAYIVQNGPFVTDATYTRILGGTTLHWEGKTPRMLPEDFELNSRYGVGRDWPVGYDDLEPYYREAEREIGVSADVEDQAYLGINFPPGYVFPMRGLPLSYLDKLVARDVDGTKVELDGAEYELRIRPFPQGRNGVPNPDYDAGRGYRPVAAVSTSQVEEGGRCQGNINCVPICPPQAKYNAGKTLAKALQSGRVDILPRTVASRVVIDPESGRVSGIEYKAWVDATSSEHSTGTVRARTFVLATNAIENARLMLASGLPSSSGLVGRNLMDHAYLLAWGLLPELAGTMRGTVCTGGIMDLRGGSFRRRQAGFAADIHNDGWGWATGAPYTDLVQLVDAENRFGRELRRELVARISHQLMLAFMVEVLPSESNRVGVDPNYRDQLGNMRPVITYNTPDYTMRGVVYARQLSRRIFQRTGARDFTAYESSDYGYVEYDGEGYAIRGGNHLAGTHLMGSSRRDSVVDAHQRSWDYDNLYLVGGGSMPSVGTSNITLTIAALCFRTAAHMITELRKESAPIEVAVG